MDISKLTTVEAIEAVSAMNTVEELRAAADSINVGYSGNTGEKTLLKNINEALNERLANEAVALEPVVEENDEPIEVARVSKKPKESIADLLEMDETQVEDPVLRRSVVRAKALRLVRVRITNLDPADAQLNGAIISAQNKYTGKVSKYIPFGDESANGYHIPQILLSVLESQQFAMRREIKGGSFGVKKYKTTMVNKFSIEVLPQLTKKELEELAAHQRASHAIDN